MSKPKRSYPIAVQLRNIKPNRRVCCKCGVAISGRGDWMVFSLSRGRYLCYKCYDALAKPKGVTNG